ncbi:MAG: hypothetical protein RIS76_594 [Verrucomicrobiota bacterium]|jgi:hypothetical protein
MTVVALVLLAALAIGWFAGGVYGVIALFSGLIPLFRLFEPENPQDR